MQGVKGVDGSPRFFVLQTWAQNLSFYCTTEVYHRALAIHDSAGPVVLSVK